MINIFTSLQKINSEDLHGQIDYSNTYLLLSFFSVTFLKIPDECTYAKIVLFLPQSLIQRYIHDCLEGLAAEA